MVASDRVKLSKDGEKHTITVKKVRKAEEGFVNVVATNEVDWFHSGAWLKVKGINNMLEL